MEKDGREGALTKDLSDLIDKYRDNLSREEFIDLCVRTFLKSRESPPTRPQKPTNSSLLDISAEQAKLAPEQEEKKQQWPPKIVQQVTEAASSVHRQGTKPKEQVASSTVNQPKVSTPATGRSQQVQIQTPSKQSEAKSVREFPGAKYVNSSSFIMLWLLAVGLYGLGDLITTNWALQLGLMEANPVARLFGNILNMALFKIATIIAAFLISYTMFHSKSLIFSAPIMMVLVGTFLTVNNALLILHILR